MPALSRAGRHAGLARVCGPALIAGRTGVLLAASREVLLPASRGTLRAARRPGQVLTDRRRAARLRASRPGLACDRIGGNQIRPVRCAARRAFRPGVRVLDHEPHRDPGYGQDN
jgi:hypothetical protein